MIRISLLAAAAAGALMPGWARAQTVDHGQHQPVPAHRHSMPAPTAAPAPAPAPAPTPTPTPGAHQHDMPAPAPSAATSGHQHHQMPPAAPAAAPHAGHDMAAMPMSAMNGASGTALLPQAAGGMTGLHVMAGDWMVMAHGYVWGAYTDQSGPRGNDHAFVQSMAMVTADRDLGGARLQLRTMWSLEPLMGRRGYPNLLATGETAGGRALVDRQHPHDLFMELAARVDVDVAPDTSLFLYGGPVGEPALGPAAFMHRASSRYLPLAPITHHWFDSTHITYGVVTAGVKHRGVQLEASAFRGREPDEERWDIETPRLDSWSVRASWAPSPNWTAQVSHGRLHEPETLHANEDEARTTASIHYGSETLSAALAWSAKNRVPGQVLTAWLAEASWTPRGRHTLFGRYENVANDELFPDHSDPLHDQRFRVARGELGYAYRLPLGGDVELALGGSGLVTGVPDAIAGRYGSATGYTLFAKLSLGR